VGLFYSYTDEQGIVIYEETLYSEWYADHLNEDFSSKNDITDSFVKFLQEKLLEDIEQFLNQDNIEQFLYGMEDSPGEFASGPLDPQQFSDYHMPWVEENAIYGLNYEEVGGRVEEAERVLRFFDAVENAYAVRNAMELEEDSSWGGVGEHSERAALSIEALSV
jgi:hypothetical protein